MIKIPRHRKCGIDKNTFPSCTTASSQTPSVTLQHSSRARSTRPTKLKKSLPGSLLPRCKMQATSRRSRDYCCNFSRVALRRTFCSADSLSLSLSTAVNLYHVRLYVYNTYIYTHAVCSGGGGGGLLTVSPASWQFQMTNVRSEHCAALGEICAEIPS